jgi:hypothetical protein
MVMKKTKYIAPDFTFTEYIEEELICASITNIGGNAGIEEGEGEAPTEADSRSYSAWGDEDEW